MGGSSCEHIAIVCITITVIDLAGSNSADNRCTKLKLGNEFIITCDTLYNTGRVINIIEGGGRGRTVGLCWNQKAKCAPLPPTFCEVLINIGYTTEKKGVTTIIRLWLAQL